MKLKNIKFKLGNPTTVNGTFWSIPLKCSKIFSQEINNRRFCYNYEAPKGTLAQYCFPKSIIDNFTSELLS